MITLKRISPLLFLTLFLNPGSALSCGLSGDIEYEIKIETFRELKIELRRDKRGFWNLWEEDFQECLDYAKKEGEQAAVTAFWEGKAPCNSLRPYYINPFARDTNKPEAGDNLQRKDLQALKQYVIDEDWDNIPDHNYVLKKDLESFLGNPATFYGLVLGERTSHSKVARTVIIDFKRPDTNALFWRRDREKLWEHPVKWHRSIYNWQVLEHTKSGVRDYDQCYLLDRSLRVIEDLDELEYYKDIHPNSTGFHRPEGHPWSFDRSLI